MKSTQPKGPFTITLKEGRTLEHAAGEARKHATVVHATAEMTGCSLDGVIEGSQDFKVGDRVLALGTRAVGIVVESSAPAGKVRVSFPDREMNVFTARLEHASEITTLDKRLTPDHAQMTHNENLALMYNRFKLVYSAFNYRLYIQHEHNCDFFLCSILAMYFMLVFLYPTLIQTSLVEGSSFGDFCRCSRLARTSC
jgi:hypothetical protein